MKIRYKLLLSVLTTVFVIFILLAFFTYASGRKALVKEIRGRSESMLKADITGLDAKFKAIQDVAESLAVALDSLQAGSEEEVRGLIKGFLFVTPEAYGSTVAFKPGTFGEKKFFSPYYYRKDGEFVYSDLGESSYNYPEWDWYKIPMETGRPVWSEPYVDVGGGDISMVTYSYPFSKDGKLWGIATVDIALPELTDIIEETGAGKNQYVSLISRKGLFLALPGRDDWVLKKSILDAAEELGSPDLAALGKKMIAGKTGFVSFYSPLIKENAWYAFGPISSTGWSVAVMRPEKELMADITELSRNIILICAIGIVIISVIIYVISGRISAPISRLAVDARRIADGDYSAHVSEGKVSRDEVGILTRSFGDMSRALQKTMGDLKTEKEMLNAAFTHMKDGVLILDGNWRVMQFNEAAKRFLALPSELPLMEHIHANFDCSMPASRITEVCDRDCTFRLSRRELEDMGELELLCAVTPIKDAGGEVRVRLMSFRDVTEEEKEEKSKRDFLALMSHKLFTPLTVLEGKLMLFKDGLLGKLEAKQQKIVDDMAMQSAKLKELIQSLVNFVTLEKGEFDRSRENIDMAGLIGEVAKEYKEWFPDKRPEISADIGPGAKEVQYNRAYLRSLLGQLIDNAIKFNMSDPVKVVIRCRKQGGKYTIEVADNGVGIPPEFQDKIFNKFYQIDRYFTGNVEGVGLGLAYVHDVVEHFGGDVGVASTPGEGSTFTVKL